MVDFTSYNPPGVYSQEQIGPQLGITSGSPRAIGIVGAGAGYVLDQETITLTGTTEVRLRRAGVDLDSVVVKNLAGNVTYDSADYSVDVVVAGSSQNTGDIVAISRESDSSIPSGSAVTVSYEYTDSKYFDPQIVYSFAEVVDRYGTAYSNDGQVLTSKITLAAQYAFLNGASRLITVATDGDGVEDFTAALNKLNDYPDIAIVVPATDARAVGTFVLSHVVTNSQNKFERRAILGFDGTTTEVASAERMSTAGSVKSDRLMLVSPDTAIVADRRGQAQYVPGWTFAAALAGRSVSQNISIPLTRKALYGFSDVPGRISESQKTQESQAGLCVIEKTLQGTIRVRHGVNTDTTDILSREWSITGQRDEQVWRIREQLDNDELIGSIITDTTLINVKATAAAALEALVMDGSIRNYQNLQVRQLISQPDVIEVRYEWRPNAPLNYIIASFSLDLTGGSVDATMTGTE